MLTSTTASIPVDLRSPGQVLGCVGFIEAAEVLLGGVEAYFDWSKAQARFVLRANGDDNPFAVVLEFLANAEIVELTPLGYVEGGSDDADDGDASPSESDDDAGGKPGRVTTLTFPSGEGVRNSLPIRLEYGERRLTVSHWADGSSRADFKLYSGNRSAHRIATQMLRGVRSKAKKRLSIGALEKRGLQQLWQEHREALVEAPFDEVTPMGGSFNFDARGAWTAIDAGYSPNTQKHGTAASPVVEVLAAIGLEHARPEQLETLGVRYAIRGHPLPPMLGRAALSGTDLKVPMLRFEFVLDLSGKNKVTTFAHEVNQQ